MHKVRDGRPKHNSYAKKKSLGEAAQDLGQNEEAREHICDEVGGRDFARLHVFDLLPAGSVVVFGPLEQSCLGYHMSPR